MKRLLIAAISFFIGILFAYPNPALFISLIFAAYHKVISFICCIIFAWNIARFVQLKYERYLDRKNEDDGKGNKCAISERDDGKGTHDADDGRYTYSVSDGKLTFTFKDIEDPDGRQLSRLKFMRRKFFK